MNKPFDMELFLKGVLTGSQSTQERHVNQAKIIQSAIQRRWQHSNPWRWKLKHIRWFLEIHLREHANSSKYYYYLSMQLIAKRLGKEALWRLRIK